MTKTSPKANKNFAEWFYTWSSYWLIAAQQQSAGYSQDQLSGAGQSLHCLCSFIFLIQLVSVAIATGISVFIAIATDTTMALSIFPVII